MISKIQVLLSAIFIVAAIPAGSAQAYSLDPESATEAYAIMRNMQGLATYCVRKGYLTQESIEHANTLTASLERWQPDKSGGDAAQAYGAKGFLLETRQPIKQNSEGLSEAEWCQQAAHGWAMWAVLDGVQIGPE
ncbi:hypothetical protein [Corticimicrobacter populi]|uniref:Uncharacterized protein n=1 Tax=Corticimicrobacter populi TaxID=2175229 RepID=A0A2V1K3D2_9BURK|nr:hypothetical protein [Corticimicrobacter populi]PWF24733.1 hypothetical protein DD235_00645 [Corticimicrobacter populi]